jgi:hypothetical protein
VLGSKDMAQGIGLTWLEATGGGGTLTLYPEP